ncbi:hypothetical protein [Saccharopolyspora gloriosae]|uniref:hypothetical protein n=1 Tax=Saccharopolyspora gloriosae TaxID=455344 RepID=UPI001FB775AC|nr:hypothetical protein [Saccharopolyspora gloriosae]
MTAIWTSDPHQGWKFLSPTDYPAESVLHDLVEQAPQMLPLAGSPRLTVLGREVRLGKGYADLIGVETSGRISVIEVKLAGNSEARRAVVAQVLSYASYLQGLDTNQLEERIIAPYLKKHGHETVLGLMQAEYQENSLDPRAFEEGLAQSLSNGAFRLVIVLDSAPDELVHVVGYLESITDELVIDLITVASYEVNGQRIVIPQRIEPARRTAELSDAEVIDRQADGLQPGSADFRAAIDDAPTDQRELLLRLTAWGESLAAEGLCTVSTYHGEKSKTLLLRIADKSGLVTVYKETRSVYLKFWRSKFTTSAPNALRTVESVLGGPVRQGSTTRDVSDDLLNTLTDAYREAAARETYSEGAH